MSKAKVYLVGAGPGHPGYITLRGVESLQKADVVLYDYLVNPVLVRHAPSQAEKICLGRHGHTRLWTQEEINRQMVDLAKQGKTVVRLKGGDPAVLARMAEETTVLAEQGIEFEVVPGVTAALAAGSCAGIPLTHRRHASAVAIVTAQQRDDGAEVALDWNALALFPGTLVIYMGVTTAPEWTAALLDAGKPADTPAAIVRRCGLPDQITIFTTLGEVATRLAPASKIRPPAVVIIGHVARKEEAAAWFENRPLFGASVLVTRPQEQAMAMGDMLDELGAEVLFQPAIRIEEPLDRLAVDDSIARLESFDWIVFSSANGVQAYLEKILAAGHDFRVLGSIRIAAIGPATVDALRQYHLRADLVPEEYRAEALAELLATGASGKRFLLIRASRGRELLAEEIGRAGGLVEQVVAYQSLDVDLPDDAVVRRLASGTIDWITVTSSAIARSLVRLFGEDLRKASLASISPITSATLQELGFEPTVEASEYTTQGVVETILESREK